MDADMILAERVAEAKTAADAAPGDADAATLYAQTLQGAYEYGTVERGRLAGDAMVPDAISKLEAAAVANPDRAGALQAWAGSVLVSAGRDAEGVARYEASMETQPNVIALYPLAAVYAADRRQSDLDPLCAATLEASTDNDTRFLVLDICANARPGMAASEALPWADAADVAFYEEQVALEMARLQAERQAAIQAEAEAEARRQAERDAQASIAASGGGSSAPATYRASVNVHNECPNTVKIFRGSLSGSYTGSGTHGSLSSNSSTSYTLTGSDNLCLLTDSGDIIACTQPADGARLKVSKACGGFMPR